MTDDVIIKSRKLSLETDLVIKLQDVCSCFSIVLYFSVIISKTLVN